MNEKFKDFYDTLIDNLTGYNGEYASFIDYGPELFRLLCDVLNEDISQDIRLKISAAIAYYVVPMDVIPEEIYGPYGYIDDIYLSVYVLKLISNDYGYGFLQNIWENDEDIESVIEECYLKTKEVLKEEQIEEILKYVGIIK